MSEVIVHGLMGSAFPYTLLVDRFLEVSGEGRNIWVAREEQSDVHPKAGRKSDTFGQAG